MAICHNCRCTMISHVVGFVDSNGVVQYFDDTEEFLYGDEELAVSIGNLSAPKRPLKEYDENGYLTDAYREKYEKYRAEKEQYNLALDKAVNDVNKNTVFNSIDDAKIWAKNNGITIDDTVFENVDLKAFNEVVPALNEMFKKYPEIKNFAYEYHDGSIYNFDFSIGITNDGLMSANRGINFNTDYFSDPSSSLYGVRQGLEQIADGTFVRGDGSFQSIVRHEYGHNVQVYIENKIAMKYHWNVDDWRKNYDTFDDFKVARSKYFSEQAQYREELLSLKGLQGASDYSYTNERELFAEGFAEYTSGAQTEFGIKFGEFLKRWY